LQVKVRLYGESWSSIPDSDSSKTIRDKNPSEKRQNMSKD